MRPAYLDTSCFTAIALRQSGWEGVQQTVYGFEPNYSSNLLEAELRSVLKREGLASDPATLLERLEWVMPTRALTPEFERVLEVGYVRGADLWHLACALFLAADPAQIVFFTLDQRQARIARKLGFARS